MCPAASPGMHARRNCNKRKVGGEGVLGEKMEPANDRHRRPHQTSAARSDSSCGSNRIDGSNMVCHCARTKSRPHHTKCSSPTIPVQCSVWHPSGHHKASDPLHAPHSRLEQGRHLRPRAHVQHRPCKFTAQKLYSCTDIQHTGECEVVVASGILFARYEPHIHE
jgi:hypothetical protein